MRHPYLHRIAARVRSSLGIDDIMVRLDAVDARVANLGHDTYTPGPLYFGDHTALVATRWGAKMLVETRDAAMAPWLVLDGLWEAHVTDWFQRSVQPGQVFVDVGANVGYFTLLGASLVGPQGRCVAVEAHPRLAELLQRNVVMNGVYGYVTTWHRAAWSEVTDLKLHVRSHFAGSSSAGSIGPESLARLGDTEEIVDVHAVPLDDLLADLPRVDVIKIDVEGAEVHAVTGLRRTLEANPRITVVFEWAPALIECVGDAPEDLVDLLAGSGFGFWSIENGQAIDRAGLLDLPYGNIVATRHA